MLDVSILNELHHRDPLQRELAVTFARALHSHTCSECRMLRVCTVVDCRFRKFPVEEREYQCCDCRGEAVAAPTKRLEFPNIDGRDGDCTFTAEELGQVERLAGDVEWAADEPTEGGDE